MEQARLLLLLLLCLTGLRVGFGVTNSGDMAALQSVMNSLQNLPSGWGQNNDPCGAPWDGIQCANDRITSVRLPGMNLKGTLSPDIGQLSQLVYLDLSSNLNLGGPLTPNIGNLKQLTTLILQGCSFTGSIPDQIGALRNLSFLALNSNQFTGRIPASIGLLSNLYWFDIAENQLSGPLPVSSGGTPGLDDLVNTKHFHFNQNQLGGTINASLFSSKMTLIHLLLDNNYFTGPIPDSIGLVQTLQIIRLDNNRLSGSVPASLTNMSGLAELNLANNQLSGPAPDLTSLTNLNYVDLSNNSFDSSRVVPSWFTSLPSLNTLVFENGGISGPIPNKLLSSSIVQEVRLDNNTFNGSLDMSKPGGELQLVSLRNNQISSLNLSDSYNGTLSLWNNPLCLNNEYSNNIFCKNQENLTPYSTSLAKCGSATCPTGQFLSPRNCTCAVPFQGLMIFRAPVFLDVSNAPNFELLESSLWTQLELAPNSVYLSGITVTSFKYMEVDVKLFPLSGTYFTVSDVIRIGFDLSNQTYDAPEQFGPYFVIQSVYPFPGSGNGGSSMSTAAIAGIAVACSVLLIALAAVAIYAIRQRKKAREATERAHPFASWGAGGKDDGTAPQLKGARYFSFDELKKCTNNFSENHEIGAGGYGKVYRGMLPNGQTAAIKRAQQGSMQGAQEFKNEIELLSRVHHKNLVSLIGFCYEQGEQMLVYEYIPNGTLRENLVGRGRKHLDWERRLRIALGSARGLAYLHELADPPIIHRDIKSTNILVDETLNAKVADFGLSKLLSDTQKGHVSTQVKGTLGYLDPEYYMTQQLSEKSDVYSFGVVMLELITARQPIEKGTYIVREVRTVIDQYDQEYYGLRDIMDSKILNQAKGPGLRRFVQLAMECVEDSASNRPTMNELVKEIEVILQNEGDDTSKNSASSSATDFNITGNPRHPYSEQQPIIRDETSSMFDTSVGYQYEPYIEPK